MANADPIVIAAAARTPIGGFQGEFKDLAAPSLGAAAAKAALVRSGVAPEDFEEVILGCVLPRARVRLPPVRPRLPAGLP